MKKIILNPFARQLHGAAANPNTSNLDGNGQPTVKGKAIVNPRSVIRPK